MSEAPTKPAVAYPTANCLAELTSGWAIIAKRYRAGAEDYWWYEWPDSELESIQRLREQGTLLTAQKRLQDGRLVLLARLRGVRVRGGVIEAVQDAPRRSR